MSANAHLPFFPDVRDDLQLGASEKLYSPDLLHSRSARSLPVPDRTREQIFADLRSYAQPVPRKRGRPRKSTLITLPLATPSASHIMVTRSQSSLTLPSNE